MASSEMKRLRRRLHNSMIGGPIGAPVDPRYLEAELDRRRQYFAEELVKLGLEELSLGSFTDTCEEYEVTVPEGRAYTDTRNTLTIEEWFLKITKAAKAAAEELYPELPEEEV